MSDIDEIEESVREYRIRLCSLCIAGVGGMCRTPGCSLWLCRAPDMPLDAWRVALSNDTSDWPVPPELEPPGVAEAQALTASPGVICSGCLRDSERPANLTCRKCYGRGDARRADGHCRYCGARAVSVASHPTPPEHSE